MAEPLQPERPDPTSDAQKPQPSREGVERQIKGTVADIRKNLQGERRIDVLKMKPIKEADLRELRERCLDRKEIRGGAGIIGLSQSDREIIDARRNNNETAVEKLILEHINRTKHVSMGFLRDAEVELAMTEIDLQKIRVLIHLGYGYAKALSAGRHNNPDALNALKAWQAEVAGQHSEAVRQLIETYRQSINAESTAISPDVYWCNQWVDLCTGFAPDLATEMTEKMHEAAHVRCEYFITQIEAELSNENPNMHAIASNIIVPPKYYQYLAPGSTIPDRVKTLQQQCDALNKE